MSDRRQTPRNNAEISCLLELEGRTVPGTLMNLSDEGALFRIDGGGETLTNDDLGLDASFLLNSTRPPRKYTGEMIRRYFLGGAEYVALRFWRKYEELPSRG